MDHTVVPEIEGYHVQSHIGSGGMGSVWRARQLSTRRSVALKLMSVASIRSEKARRRFEREIEMAARLDDPHIVHVYDSGVHRGVYYYAMELVDGLRLDQYVQSHRLRPRQILLLMRTVCLAVQHAHQQGVIHRDLKPSNILVNQDGRPCVLDFGLAKEMLEEPGAETVSVDGDLAGTVAYMSPEQAAGKRKLDTRADVYALGVILYRLLTDHPPHDICGTLGQITHRIVNEEIRRPRDASAAIDAELESLLMKALAKDLDQRYASAGELARDIDNYLNGEPLTAQRPSVAYFLRKRLRKHQKKVILAMAVATAAVALIAIGFVRERRLGQIAMARAEAYRRSLYFNQISLAESAASRGHHVRAGEQLDRCPPDLRHWEWGYLYRILDQSTATIRDHETSVLWAALAKSDSSLISVDYRSIRVRDVHARTMRVRLWPDRDLEQVVASADGRWLVSSNMGTVTVWDLVSGQRISRSNSPSLVQAMAISADGSTLAIGYDRGIEIRGLSAAEPVETLDVDSPMIRALAFSPDGQFLAVGGRIRSQPGVPALGNKGMVVIRYRSSDRDGPVFELKGTVGCLAFSPDQRRLAAGAARHIDILDPHGDSVIHTLSGNGRCLAYSPDGTRLVSGGDDGTLTIWDASSYDRPIAIRRGHRRPITSLAFSADGRRVVSGSDDTTIKFWNLHSGTEQLDGSTPVVAMSRDQRWFARGGANRSIDVLRVDTGRVVQTFRGQAYLESILFAPQGRHLLGVWGLGDVRATLWRIGADLPGVNLSGRIDSPIFSPDGRMIAACSGDQIRRWQVSSATELDPLSGFQATVRSVAFGPRGQRLVSGHDDGAIYVWDLQSGQAVTGCQIEGEKIFHVSFSPSGYRILAGSLNGQVRLLATDDLRLVTAFRNRRHCVAFSADGRWVASGGYGQITIMDAMKGTQRHQLMGHDELVTAMAFSPDGLRVASGGHDATVKLWDAQTGTEVLTLAGHRASVQKIVFSPDGQSITSIDDSGALRVWRASDRWQTASATSPAVTVDRK